MATHVVVFGFDLARNLCSHFLVRSLRHSGLFAFHVPVVKIEPALLYHEEQVIDACGISQVERIFLPGRTRRNIHCSKERTVFGTGMEFKLTAVAPSANDNAVGTVAHVNRAYLGIEAVTHIGQVNRTVLSLHMFDDGVAARRIDCHATHPRLGLGFHAHERVKVLDGLYDAIVGSADSGNGTVGIPGEFFNCGRTAVAAALHVLLVMIEEEAAALKVDNAGVNGERGTRFAFRHNDALVGPGTRRGITPGIVNGFGNATGGVNHVIFFSALVDPRAFGILAVKGAHVGDLDVACAFDHVLLEGAIIELRVTPVEPCLAIVVNKYGGVDVVPVGARQVLAVQGILEGAFLLVGHGHVDGAAAAGGFHGHVIIVLVVAANALRCPVAVFLGRTVEVTRFQNEGVHVGPVHHIRGARYAPAVHRKKATALVVAGIGAKRIAEHDRRRVRRIIGLDKRVFGHGLRAEPETNQGDSRLNTLRKHHISSLYAPTGAIFFTHPSKISPKKGQNSTRKGISRGQVINMP